MSQALRDSWRALLAQPLQFVTEDCLDAALLGAVSRRQVASLASQPRFQARIGELLASYYGLQALPTADEVGDDDLPVVLLPPARFARLPFTCGASLHAASIAREIRGPVVQALRAHLGDEAYQFAIGWREPAEGKPPIIEGDALLTAIAADGQRCLDAWLAAQPEALQAWLRLRFDLPAPPGASCVADVRRVRQIAAALSGNDQQGVA